MFIDGRWYTETELAALVISLKADNERVVEANKKISGMYWEQMNKNIEQKKKIEELEEKHWDECRQIAQYDNELKEAKKLLEFIRTVATEKAKELETTITVVLNGMDNKPECPNIFPEHVNCRCVTKPSEPDNKSTNYDKIKGMSVEEMAEWFNNTFDCCSYGCEGCTLELKGACTKVTIAKWLESEVGENDSK